jgi:hypothetical protein
MCPRGSRPCYKTKDDGKEGERRRTIVLGNGKAVCGNAYLYTTVQADHTRSNVAISERMIDSRRHLYKGKHDAKKLKKRGRTV